MLLGGHLVKSWSTTQAGVALSSGEAEYYGMVKGACVAMGFAAMAAELNVCIKVRVHTDSSAARSICQRSGVGKVRHIAVHLLWLQEKVKDKTIEVWKVHGVRNPADLCTKFLTARQSAQFSERVGLHSKSGRAHSAPMI